MDDLDGLRFVLYDKAGVFRRSIMGAESAADLLVNGISTAEITLDDDHVAAVDVVTPGMRCAIEFRGKERFRGRIQSTPGAGPEGTITARVESDLRKFWDWYGWPVPSAPLNAQTSEYRVYTGPSESVFKTAVSENIARLGVPWTVAPTLGRGSTSRAELRMHPLADKLLPLLDADGLVVVLSYADSGPGVTVDIREGNTVTGVLTIESGVPDGYEFTTEAPTATRVIVGGRGEGIEREFVQVIDAAREAEWGDIIESFKDARNTEEGSDISGDGLEVLAEGAPRVGIATQLVETERFMFGTTYDVGDFVAVRLGPVESLEQITGVSITETADEGVVVTPHIGEADVSADTDVALARAVASLARGVRDSGRR